jgi:dihydrofolate reductase
VLISLIAAVDENNGIGLDGRIPWRLSTDLRRFKSLTMGHHLVMGRKTFESIGRPLPGRTSLVVTRRKELFVEGVIMARSLEEALSIAENAGENEVFVLGGGQIFTQALPLAGKIYLTRVAYTGPADTFFPALDLESWTEELFSTHPPGPQDEYAHTFHILTRRSIPA